MSFAVGADAYDRFMGRYSTPLAPEFADLVDVGDGPRALDVGCGPGALTAELVARLGPAAVTAVDPSDSFVDAARARYPMVDVHRSSAEQLPFGDRVFDVTLAQLVVHFMDDPVAGLREMARVTRVGGVVAACVWDHDGGEGPLSRFWDAAHDLDRGAEGEARLAGAREGDLAQLFGEAGLDSIEESALSVTVEHPTFDEWWEPFTLGVGPAGRYVSELDAAQRAPPRPVPGHVAGGAVRVDRPSLGGASTRLTLVGVAQPPASTARAQAPTPKWQLRFAANGGSGTGRRRAPRL